MNKQLALSIQLHDDVAFENFVPGRNVELIARLSDMASGRASDGSMYIWGAPGSGKSHLLQAACRQAGEQDVGAVYLPMRTLADESELLLEGLESLPLVCIDDLQAVVGQARWEEALFHLYNRCFEAGVQLIVAAEVPLAESGIQLQDLMSRLAWGFVYRIHELSDEEKMQAIRQRANERGFDLPENVAQYLLKHYQRDTHALFALLDELDSASLAAQRKLTLPFVRELLAGGLNRQPSLF